MSNEKSEHTIQQSNCLGNGKMNKKFLWKSTFLALVLSGTFYASQQTPFHAVSEVSHKFSLLPHEKAALQEAQHKIQIILTLARQLPYSSHNDRIIVSATMSKLKSDLAILQHQINDLLSKKKQLDTMHIPTNPRAKL